MAFERDQPRQRSYSDPTGLRSGTGPGPGKRTLTQGLVPAAPPPSPVTAHDEVAQAANVPLPASRPGTPVAAAHDEVAQAAQVPLPTSRPGTPMAAAHDEVAQAANVPLPASRPGTPVAAAHDEVAQAAQVPLPASRPGTPVAAAHDEVAQAAQVPLPASRPGTPVATAHDEVAQAANVPLPASRPGTPVAAAHDATPEAPRSTWDRRAEYYKATSYLTASLGTLVSAIGWILLRQFPSMQPIGQGLASDLKNGFGALDDAAKGNQPKAIGQSVSAVGQAVGMGGVIAVSQHPQASQLTGIRGAGAGVNAIGYGFTGVGENQAGNPAKATGNFVAAVGSVVGMVGYTVESAKSQTQAFLTLEAANSFNNVATSVGGAIDDGRKSKVDRPWLKDPKVVGQEIAALGFALSGVASVLAKVYGTEDKEAGTHELDQLSPLIQTLGAIGMFLGTVGYAVSAYAEAPRKPRDPDIEMQPPR